MAVRWNRFDKLRLKIQILLLYAGRVTGLSTYVNLYALYHPLRAGDALSLSSLLFTFTGLKLGDGTRWAVSGRSVWVMTAGRAQAHPYPLSRRFCALWLAQGSYAVQLCLWAVLVLPNFARSCHHSQIPGGTEQFLFSTHKALKIKVVSLLCKDI